MIRASELLYIITANSYIQYFYTGNLFWFRIFGYGLKFDRAQPTFVRRMFGHGYISIGKWDIEVLWRKKQYLVNS